MKQIVEPYQIVYLFPQHRNVYEEENKIRQDKTRLAHADTLWTIRETIYSIC